MGKGKTITVHKKGDQQSSYREITMLNTQPKIMSTILQHWLTRATKNILGKYHGGLTKRKSTVDTMRRVKQILEKAREYEVDLEIYDN